MSRELPIRIFISYYLLPLISKFLKNSMNIFKTHLKCSYSFNFIIKILLQMNIKGIIVSLSKGVFTKLQNMIIIFSILFFSSIFTTNISGFKDPNLPEDFFSKWENSQVFIYHRMRFSQKFQSEYPYPNCFGNLLTANLVLTATSCFIHLKERP